MFIKNQIQHPKNSYQGNFNKNQSLNQPVKIYLRRPNKQTQIINIKTPVQASQLISLASQKTNIKQTSILLFLHGVKIDDSATVINLNSNDIVHVHNRQQTYQKTVKIVLKPFDCYLQIQQSVKVQVRVKSKIGQQLSRHVQINQDIILIQSGRKLDLQKTFQQQFIQDDSTIVLTSMFKKTQQVSKQRIQKQNIQEKREQNRQIKNQLKSFSQLCLKPLMFRKSLSWSTSDHLTSVNRLSFKKKQKFNIYKSQKISEGQEVWQSDSSGDLQRALRKKLSLKKHRGNFSNSTQFFDYKKVNKVQKDIVPEDHMTISDEEDEDEEQNDIEDRNQGQPIFSSNERKQLNRQLRKILGMDILQDSREQRKQQKQLFPKMPKIFSYDFIQQSQQIQIVNDEQAIGQQQQLQQDKQKKNDLQTSKKGSINLRQSIGKSRGTYVCPMIPTRDFGNQAEGEQEQEQESQEDDYQDLQEDEKDMDKDKHELQ